MAFPTVSVATTSRAIVLRTVCSKDQNTPDTTAPAATCHSERPETASQAKAADSSAALAHPMPRTMRLGARSANAPASGAHNNVGPVRAKYIMATLNAEPVSASV